MENTTKEQRRWMLQGAHDAYMMLQFALLTPEEAEQVMSFAHALCGKKVKDANSISNRKG